MELVHAAVRTLRLKLSVPFRTSLRATDHVVDIRVCLETTDGLKGYGSASPTPAITGETESSIVSALEEHIFPALKRVDLADESSAFAAIQGAIVHNSSSKAAADIALHDLYARQQGIGIRQRLVPETGSHSSTIITVATVSLGSIPAMVKQAGDLKEEGFHTLKVKLGGRDGLDVERVKEIRNQVGRTVRLQVDANQAWTTAESIAVVEQLGRYDVLFVEQPVLACDLDGLQAVTRASALPIAADESVFSIHDLKRLVSMRAAKIVNLKLMKTGGITPALAMRKILEDNGVEVMVGSMMEGPISVTAAASFASVFQVPFVDLDAAYFLKDKCADGGLTYSGEMIQLSDGLGLGCRDKAVSNLPRRKE